MKTALKTSLSHASVHAGNELQARARIGVRRGSGPSLDAHSPFDKLITCRRERFRISFRGFAGILLAGFFLTAARCALADDGAPASPASLSSLRTAALGEDVEKSLAALRELAAQGSRGSQTLAEIVPQIVARDAAAIESESAALTPQLPKLRAAEAEMDALRAAMFAAIDNLTTDPQMLKSARVSFARMSNTMARLTPIYLRQMHVAQAWARRAQCLQLQPQPRPAGPDRLSKLAEAALAMPPDVAAAFVTGPLDPPSDAARRRLWHFITCRRIESWNRQFDSAMNAAEAAHFRRVNFYRELLGLLPYEVDLRLVQSARRHSKEMIDLWYFGHYSPTESERSPFSRMARAGYAAGSNENITMGSWTAEDAFWQFFNSPDHHRAWIDRDATAMGIGKWEFAWTQDLGGGPRLMTATAAAIAKAAVLGTELKPQATEQTRQHPRDLATIKFYDESGQEVKQIPGVEKKTSVRPAP